jgi:hypothetical protein
MRARPGFEGLMCGLNSMVDVSRIPCLNVAQRLAGGWIDDSDGLS